MAYQKTSTTAIVNVADADPVWVNSSESTSAVQPS